MERKGIDLHMHTSISDGTDSPEEILLRVKEAGIGLFSVTDHDALKGSRIIPPLLRKGDPRFLSGAEFSCKDEKGKYHILGYGYDPEAAAIRDVVEYAHRLRIMKVTARLDYLKSEFGFEFPPEELEALMALDNPGKPHIANMMVKYGYAQSKEQAFDDVLNRMPVLVSFIRPEQAIEAILAGGGIPILAHPSYGDGDQLFIGEEMEQRICRLMAFGLKGLEAFYSGFTPPLVDEILSYADRYDLYVTAGSDYHGANKMIVLGDTGIEEYETRTSRLERFLKDGKPSN